MLLASCCFAQDGIPPDTLFPFISGKYYGIFHEIWSTYPDSGSCAFYGDSSHSACGITGNEEPQLSPSTSIGALTKYSLFPSESWSMERGLAMFDLSLGNKKRVDSVDLRLKLALVSPFNVDTLFVMSPEIRCKETCEEIFACYDDSCNYYRCGGSGSNWPTSYLDWWFGTSLPSGYWLQFDIDGECRKFLGNDTVVYGFVTQRFSDGDIPSSSSEYWTADPAMGDTAAILIYWFHNTFNLLLPPDSSIVHTANVNFVWESCDYSAPADSIDFYRLYIANDAVFTVNLDSVQTDGADTTYTWTGLGNMNFWWKVKAFDTEDSATVSDSVFMFFHRSYNDISYQSSDSISPDTIFFICSGANDTLRTPGFWREQYQATWNIGDPGANDAFHGRNTVKNGCDSSRSCNYWNYAMQPWIHAWKRSVFNDYRNTRAYFLMELEEPIPDTTELDSMRFYMQFAAVTVKDGDSVHVVTYTPRYSRNESDSCWICYSCDYGGFPDAWCNYWRCGDYEIWGERSVSIPGRVPVYLGWNWFPIHPDIIDFTEASVGDTFGVGLVLKFEDSPAPTDSNMVTIMTDPCPYIVYWFSKHEEEADSVSGYINYGLKPDYLRYGLPINQVRRAWGGGRH